MIDVKPILDLNKRIEQLAPFIGNTPLFPISRVYQKPGVKIFAKLEWYQLGASVKARPAYHIIREAIRSGELTEGKHLIDASSGNTAIAYAAIGAAAGVLVTICIPENASKERKQILKSYGVDVIYTPATGEMNEAQDRARELAEERHHQYYYADQYSNPNNWRAHYYTTAEEIFAQTHTEITHFVAGLGTTGTFVGTTRRLKEINPEIQCISLQPNAVFHGLEGWKHLDTARVPQIYDSQVADENLEVDTLEAHKLLKRVAQEEGLLLSPSAAANLLGAIQVAEQIDEGVIVTTFADSADKYSEVMETIFT
uniref:PLP-dependent cysteine synthase family protein n=1 Tax=Roseihalotalea indica TaxID=2867963 RepID=A0AA49JKE1_9BACT|nr:PLP-dependent cysteine synthase family protein [Tunicatimonas sp. TK19036]